MRHLAIRNTLKMRCHIANDTVYDVNGNLVEYDQELVDAEMARLLSAKPMSLLREERNSRLEMTDWWAMPDRVMTNDQQVYRQRLRDLPAIALPTLDDSGKLSGVEWPKIPE